QLVTSVAIHLNDTLDDVSRQRLKGFIPRLLQARRGPADARIGVRLAIWAAESIADSAPERLRPLHDRAVAAAAGRLDGTVTEAACRASAAEAGAKARNVALYVAADAAHAACADDPSGAAANAVAGALHRVLGDGGPLAWFDAGDGHPLAVGHRLHPDEARAGRQHGLHRLLRPADHLLLVLLQRHHVQPAAAGRHHPQAGRLHPRHPARAADRA